jgi:hypothetical protein
LPRQAVKEKEDKMVSECNVKGKELKASYCVGTTRVETGCRPLDLFLFFGGYFATVKQVRDKVGDCGSLGLQQERREGSGYGTIQAERKQGLR